MNVVEIGILTGDLKAAVAEMEKLGFNGWEFGEFDTRVVPNSRLNGENTYFIIKSASYKNGNVAVEMIEPQTPGFFMDCLEKNGPGIHHIAIEPEEGYASYTNKLMADGCKMAMELCAMETIPALGYLDTFDKLGFFLELHAGGPEEV